MNSSEAIAYRRYLTRTDENIKAYKFINKASKIFKDPKIKEDAELVFKQVSHIYDPNLYKSFYGKAQVENPIPLSEVFNDSNFPDRLRWVKKLLPKYETGSVLDIGCSEGSYSLNLAKEGYLVTGINLFEKSIETAKERTKQEGLDEMTAIAEVIRRRGSTKGVYGCTAQFDDEMPYMRAKGIISLALRAVERSRTSNLSGLATHFENLDFGIPKWASGMEVTAKIGKTTFFKSR